MSRPQPPNKRKPTKTESGAIGFKSDKNLKNESQNEPQPTKPDEIA